MHRIGWTVDNTNFAKNPRATRKRLRLGMRMWCPDDPYRNQQAESVSLIPTAFLAERTRRFTMRLYVTWSHCVSAATQNVRADDKELVRIHRLAWTNQVIPPIGRCRQKAAFDQSCQTAGLETISPRRTRASSILAVIPASNSQPMPPEVSSICVARFAPHNAAVIPG